MKEKKMIDSYSQQREFWGPVAIFFNTVLCASSINEANKKRFLLPIPIFNFFLICDVLDNLFFFSCKVHEPFITYMFTFPLQTFLLYRPARDLSFVYCSLSVFFFYLSSDFPQHQFVAQTGLCPFLTQELLEKLRNPEKHSENSNPEEEDTEVRSYYGIN